MILRTPGAMLLALAIINGASAQSTTSVFDDAQPRIYLSIDSADQARLNNPHAVTGDAVADLLRCFKLLTGHDLPTQPADGLVPLRLVLTDPDQELGHQGYQIDVTPEQIVLSAPTRQGVFNAIYDILDRWGCRWIMPGPDGEIIPRVDRLELEIGTPRWNGSMDGRVEAPPDIEFAMWVARNRMGQESRLSAYHAFHAYLPPKDYFQTHPDYFAMIGGRRAPRQLETANPEVIELLIEKARQRFAGGALSFPMDWEDTPEFSTSPESLALDPANNPRFFGLPSMTDRTVKLANAIAQAVESEYPDRKIAFYGYTHHTLPPVDVVPHKNIAVGVTRAGFSIVHLTPHERNPHSTAWWNVLEQWLKVCSYVFTYDYDPVPWTGGLISPVYLERAEALKKMHAMGVKGNYSDKAGARSDAANYVSQYLEWRIKADPRRDPRQELTEMCRTFFGPAAEPIEQYYLALAKVTSTNYPEHGFTNFGAGTFHELFTPEIIAEARKHLTHAVTAAKDDAVAARRVEMVRLNFEYLDSFLQGTWAAKARQYDRAVSAFDDAGRAIDALAALDSRFIAAADAHTRLELQKQIVLAENFPDRMGMMRQWSLLGPLANDHGDFDFHDEMFPPRWFAGDVMVGKPTVLNDGTRLSWQTYRSPEGLVDFSRAFKKTIGHEQPIFAAYAATVVEVPQAIDVQLRTDSFFPFRVYLNGQELFHRAGWNFMAPDRQIIPARLNAGRNVIVFRSSQACAADVVSRWGFYFRVTDSQGKAIPQLKIGL